MNELDGKSLDITDNLLRKLKCECPEIFTDEKIDFEKLKLILGENIETSDEKYQFTWKGKNEAIKISQTPSMGTLRPDKESSKNWDNTENLYIEGDNLEVLKLLQKSYFGKIKMIYIDPPYNTGKDFVYKDNFKDNISNYKEITKQKSKANVETNGRYHTDWLNMMYPRLKLARNLLKENGVIFISIDEKEVHNLRKICDEIFGEENFGANFVWEKGKEGGNDSSLMRSHYENILMYTKSNSSKDIINLDDKDTSRHMKELPEENLVLGVEIEERKGELFQLINLSKQKDYNYNIKLKNGESIEWRGYLSLNTFNDYLKKGRIYVGKNKVPYVKSFLIDELSGQKPSNLLGQKFGTTKSGTKELKDLMGEKIFTYPKPSSLIERLIKIGLKEDDIILDFFSGSCSTAHATIKLNNEDDGNRKFIMVQLPEQTDEKSEAYKAGYKNICEIGKERIRRAGEKIASETGKSDLDIGFKVFKLDDSNIKTWDSNYNNLEMTLFDMEDNIKEDRNQEDLLYEILLKMGYPLTSEINEISISDKTIFNIENSLLVCLENEINTTIVKCICEMNIEDKDTLKVIFKDSGFKSDKDKMNALENLKQYGILDVRSV